MLNLIPALLFLLVQGHSDPDANLARAEILRRLATYARLEAQSKAETAAPASDVVALASDPSPKPSDSTDQVHAPQTARLAVGLGSTILTRAGPAA